MQNIARIAFKRIMELPKPTMEDIALSRPVKTGYATTSGFLLTCFGLTVVAIGAIFSLPKIWFWILLLPSIVLALAVSVRVAEPVEIKSKRVVDVEKNDLLLLRNNGYFCEIAPVVDSYEISDSNPVVALVVARETQPFSRRTDEWVHVAQSQIRRNVRSLSENDEHALRSAFECLIGAPWSDDLPEDCSGKTLDIFRRLGFVERMFFGLGGWRLTESAKQYKINSEIRANYSAPHEPSECPPPIMVVVGELVVSAEGVSMPMSQIVEQLRNLVTLETERVVVDKIREAIRENNSEATREGFRKLGIDVLTNALGGALGNALWATVFAPLI